MRRAVSGLVRRYVESYADDLHRVWAVERPFELHVPDGTVAGRADVILDQEGGAIGSLAIVDYKAAQDTMRDERYRQQLAVYAAAGRGEGLDVAAAYLHDLRDSTRHLVDIAAQTTSSAVDSMAQAVAKIRGGRFEAKPEPEKCGRCDFLRICGHRDAGAPIE